MNKMMADARARHNMVNKLMKDYRVLWSKFRGDIGWHHYIFGAMANLGSANEDLEWRNGAIPGLPARCRPSGLIQGVPFHGGNLLKFR